MSVMQLKTGSGLFNGHSSLSLKSAPSARLICECCPYGYHIDLGFVEFCERLTKENAQSSVSKNERRERRRQRKSMDVLLGLDNTMFWNVQQFLPAEYLRHGGVKLLTEPPPPPPPPPPRKSSFLCENEGLKKAMLDFETTLERTTKPNLRSSEQVNFFSAPDSVAEPVKQALPEVPDLPTPLQTIREQMAISLEKIKEMESQVKVLPFLKQQITDLENDKSKLISKVTELTHELSIKQRELENPKKVMNRDVGVLCVASKRDTSTGTPLTVVKTVSTWTGYLEAADKSTETDKPDESRRISLKDLDAPPMSSTATQTNSPEVMLLKVVEKRDVAVQSVNPENKITRDIGILAKPKMMDAGTDKKTITKERACSDDVVSNLLCDRCVNIRTKSVGVGSGYVKDPAAVSPGAGLANRSKSFDYSNRKQTRSIGISTIPPIKKLTATKQVGTVEVSITRVHAGVNTLSSSTRDASVSVNFTDGKIPCEDCNKTELKVDSRESEAVKETLKKDNSHVSKIPRPTGPKTPVMNRKTFVRQDTYSKTLPVGVENFTPRLKSSPEKAELPEDSQTFVTLRKKSPKPQDPVADISERVSSDLHLEDNRASIASSSADRYSGFFEDGAYDYDEHYGEQESNRNSQMFPDSAMFQPIQEKSREKLVPSKEMKAAMKVVNDGLHKFPDGLPKNLKTASSIIQQEWFKISSTANANPLDVEDYLDNFEEVSNTLLEFVVNMIDNNGNTAMHYAVSHGNFDVVSILLDSKVCNINKANAAGYTCIMLVSLAQVRSETHREVVRRLFLLADVNVRAKQHGQTALMLAVSHGRLDMVQLLLEAGADPNIQDCDGSTALMCAAEHGHLEIVKQILAHPDCDPSIVDCDGSSALAIAMEAGNRDIGVLLYAREHFAPNSRGNSPYTSFKRRSRAVTSPHSKTPTSPGFPKRPDHSF